MNTANLQLTGVYAAIAALLDAIRTKGVLSADEIDAALSDAERIILEDPNRPAEVSRSNVEAMAFPLRYLRAANRAAVEGRDLSFVRLATEVGTRKPDV